MVVEEQLPAAVDRDGVSQARVLCPCWDQRSGRGGQEIAPPNLGIDSIPHAMRPCVLIASKLDPQA
jgi:hypothetical protein